MSDNTLVLRHNERNIGKKMQDDAKIQQYVRLERRQLHYVVT